MSKYLKKREVAMLEKIRRKYSQDPQEQPKQCTQDTPKIEIKEKPKGKTNRTTHNSSPAHLDRTKNYFLLLLTTCSGER